MRSTNHMECVRFQRQTLSLGKVAQVLHGHVSNTRPTQAHATAWGRGVGGRLRGICRLGAVVGTSLRERAHVIAAGRIEVQHPRCDRHPTLCALRRIRPIPGPGHSEHAAGVEDAAVTAFFPAHVEAQASDEPLQLEGSLLVAADQERVFIYKPPPRLNSVAGVDNQGGRSPRALAIGGKTRQCRCLRRVDLRAGNLRCVALGAFSVDVDP